MKTTPAAARRPAAKPGASRKSPAPNPAAKTARARRNAGDALRARVARVRAVLDSKKGENIVVMDMARVSGVADYMVLCSGLNAPHLRALADEVVRQLRLETPAAVCYRRAGAAESEWLVLDYLDFVVHLFTPGMRAYYALEQLWKDAPVLP